ncbi:MAG: hypothetical protein Q4F13_07475 [Pseudomonadota bacterium]|nr:hypothetical protein [Pseudomonadota bacterium]
MPGPKPLYPLLLTCLLAASPALQAQTPAAPEAQLTRDAPVLDRHTQRVEHITHEDAGSRVDEVRSGGETRHITVQPKAPVPAYDVLPPSSTGTSRETAPGGTGPRVWKIPF